MIARILAAAVLVLALASVHAPVAHAAEPPPAGYPAGTVIDSVTPVMVARSPSGARDYLAEARASFTPENRAYQRQRVLLAVVSPLIGIAIGLLMLFTGVAQAFRDLANARARNRWARVLVFFTLYSLAASLVMLPLDWYSGWALEQRFGLSNQGLGAWALDQLKAFVFQIVAVGGLPFLALAWRVIENHPKRWWLWLSIGALPISVAIVLLQPLVFDPLFNKFTTLHDASLRSDILALAARADIPARDVCAVDMSAQTKKGNGYGRGVR